MLKKMSEEKATTKSTITFNQNEVLQMAAAHPKSRPYRKYAIIAVTGVVVAAVILTAILVGMYLFTQGQKDILKFSYNRDENTKEDVISDPNTNIVQYHVADPAYEMWVVNDFNRDIQVVKIKEARGTNCFVTPLNRTMATDPSKVTIPSNIKKKEDSTTVSYRASDTTIPDISFLSKAAKDTCHDISTYWMYPSCDTPKGNAPTYLKRSPESSSRKKRCTSTCYQYKCLSTGYCIKLTWKC